MTRLSAILRSRIFAITTTVFVAFLAFILALLHWGGYLLVRNDTLPPHADGAVVLQGSMISEDARILGAIVLLQQGTVDTVLLSIPQTGYWGQSPPQMARTYLERTYGAQIAERFEFCLTSPTVNSTEDEAAALMPCIEGHHWRSIIVVTSNFHSRRAGMIWQRVWRHARSPVRLWIDAAPDPQFQPNGWWRRRLYAKIWFLESTKLLWNLTSFLRNKHPSDVQDLAHSKTLSHRNFRHHQDVYKTL